MASTVDSIATPPAAAQQSPGEYWEARAQRFARIGPGLRAVCSYGMPAFYNRSIHLSQRLALARWLGVKPGSRVLDVGCGVGRWSRRMAARGAQVTGVDLSATMIDEAQRRSAEEGVGDQCRFLVSDLSKLELGEKFPLIVGVTVLQHLLEKDSLRAAVERLASHLEPGGRMVLLEAMPSRRISRCDTPIFTARSWEEYRELFNACGLKVKELAGVDPAPFKTLFLPYYKKLPRPIANAILFGLMGLSLPIDVIFGRSLVRNSWHKVAVLEHRSKEIDAA